MNKLINDYIENFDADFDAALLDDPKYTKMYIEDCLSNESVMETQGGLTTVRSKIVSQEQLLYFRKILKDKTMWEDGWEEVYHLVGSLILETVVPELTIRNVRSHPRRLKAGWTITEDGLEEYCGSKDEEYE